jgi:hypothetical protein
MGVLKAFYAEAKEAKKLSKSSQAITISPNVGRLDTPVVGEAYTGFHIGDTVKHKQTGAVGHIDAAHHVEGEGANAKYVFRVAHEGGGTGWHHQDKLEHIKEDLDETTAIHVKKGAFHRWLGKPEDAKITAADIAKGKAAGGHAAKMAEFAQNFGHIGEETIDEGKVKFPVGAKVKVTDRGHPHFGMVGQVAGHSYGNIGGPAGPISKHHRVEFRDGTSSQHSPKNLALHEETLDEAFKKGDTVVATKDTDGGTEGEHVVKKGTKGTYQAVHQGIDQPYHHINWEGHPKEVNGYPFGHTKSEFKKLSEETLDETKAMLNKFRKNEDENYHAENSLMLAKHFGTPEEHSAMKRHVAAVHNNLGASHGRNHPLASAIQSKYFHHLAKFEETIHETLGKGATASDYVDDFVHSRNKMFKGDSKKQRIKRALGAYYGAKNESLAEAEHNVVKHTDATTWHKHAEALGLELHSGQGHVSARNKSGGIHGVWHPGANKGWMHHIAVSEETLDEIRSGRINNHPWEGRNVKWHEDGKEHEGVVHSVHREHTFSQMVPFKTEVHIIKPDSDAYHIVRKEHVSIAKGSKTVKEDTVDEDVLDEGARMPSSVIKHKQKLGAMTPEELHTHFSKRHEYNSQNVPNTYADRAKSMEKDARMTAWRHGHGHMSSHYWDKIKNVSEEITEQNKTSTVYTDFDKWKEHASKTAHVQGPTGGLTYAVHKETGRKVGLWNHHGDSGHIDEETVVESGDNPNHDAAGIHTRNKLKRSVRRHLNSKKK